MQAYGFEDFVEHPTRGPLRGFGEEELRAFCALLGPGFELQLAAPKGEQRSRDKAKIKYGNDWKLLVDLNRATVVCPDATALCAGERAVRGPD